MDELARRRLDFERSLLAVDKVAANRLLAEAARDMSAVNALDQLVVPALEKIGAAWEQGQASLAQVYMSGRICEDLVTRMLPLPEAERRAHPPMAIAVLEDYHQLGKRIVYSVLRASGFDLIDYGAGITVGDLAKRTRDDGIQILLVSTLMLPAALRVGELVRALQPAGNTRVLVGGAPFIFDPRLWQEVGASAMGKNATEAVALVTRVTEELL